MDYEKKYKDTLERAKKLYEQGTITESLSYVFPELVEPEDEKIRKSIHIYLDWLDGRKDYAPRGEYTIRDMMSWLEKQGQTFTKKDIDDAYLKGVSDTKHELEKQSEQKPYGQREECLDCQFNYAGECKGFCQMKRGEQKPADKVEPKFKVGDWILYSGDHYEGVRHITKINEKGYYIERNGLPHGIIPFNHEICMRLWTIQDAKDGDVLISELSDSIILFKGIEDNNIQFYCDYDLSEIDVPGDRFAVNNSGQHYGNIEESEDFHPATKEQRDTFFAKMKESGYEWDAERKELKKIEQKSQRMISAEAKEAMYDKPAWSEEDDMMIKETLYFLREYQQSNRCKDENGMQNSVSCEKWLKSLKERIGG